MGLAKLSTQLTEINDLKVLPVTSSQTSKKETNFVIMRCKRDY